jgi:hypothetical protein
VQILRHILKSFLIAIPLIVGISGCNKPKIMESDLTGIWVLRNTSKESLPTELKESSPRIVLNADGSFIATDLPEELPRVPPSDMQLHARLDSGTGVWKLGFWQSQQQLQLVFHAFTAGPDKVQVPFGMLLKIESKTSIFYYLSDPDLGVVIRFERQ